MSTYISTVKALILISKHVFFVDWATGTRIRYVKLLNMVLNLNNQLNDDKQHSKDRNINQCYNSFKVIPVIELEENLHHI